MRVYICGNCGNPLYFENSLCLSCKHPVGFDAESLSMVTLDEKKPGEFVAFKTATGRQALSISARMRRARRLQLADIPCDSILFLPGLHPERYDTQPLEPG